MDIETSKIIVLRIIKILDERGISQKQLAESINKPTNTLSLWLSGKRKIDLASVIAICKYLNISTDYILGFQSVPTTDKDEAFVSEYIGLKDISVKEIKRLTADAEYRRIIDFLSYNGSFVSEFSENRRSRLHFLCYLLQALQCNLKVEKEVIDKIMHELSFNEIKNADSDNPLFQLFDKLDTYSTVGLYNLQEAIKDYAKDFLKEYFDSIAEFKALLENKDAIILSQVEMNEWQKIQTEKKRKE